MVSILILGALGYGTLVGAAYVFQRNLLYFPQRTAPQPNDWGAADMQVVALHTADGLTLRAWYRAPANRDSFVFTHFHGNASHIGSSAWKLCPLMTAGHGLLLPEYRGYSGNPGRPSEEGLYADGRAALAFLAHSGITARRIVLYGESLGTGVVVQLATETEDLAAIILEAPFTSVPDAGARHYFWLPVHALSQDRYENLKKMDQVTAPLLILHGERDRIVPAAHGRRLHQAAGAPKRLVLLPDARHNDLHLHGNLVHILRFVEDLGGAEESKPDEADQDGRGAD